MKLRYFTNTRIDSVNQLETNRILPTGGTANQMLIKNSVAEGDFAWTNPPVALPTGGATGNILVKQSATDGDAAWANVGSVPVGGTTNQVLAKVDGTNFNTQWVATQAPITSATQTASTTTFISQWDSANSILRTKTITFPNNSLTSTNNTAGLQLSVNEAYNFNFTGTVTVPTPPLPAILAIVGAGLMFLLSVFSSVPLI